jgi:hypothetical protein
MTKPEKIEREELIKEIDLVRDLIRLGLLEAEDLERLRTSIEKVSELGPKQEKRARFLGEDVGEGMDAMAKLMELTTEERESVKRSISRAYNKGLGPTLDFMEEVRQERADGSIPEIEYHSLMTQGYREIGRHLNAAFQRRRAGEEEKSEEDEQGG